MRLRGEALAPFAPPALKDGPATAGAHAGAETVGLRPLPLLRLVGALHRGGVYGRRRKSFLRHLRGTLAGLPGTALWSPPGGRRLSQERTRGALASGSGPPESNGPGVHFPPLAGAVGSRRIR